MNAPWRKGHLVRNGILGSLSSSEFAAIRPLLHPVTLQARSILQEPNRRVEYIHFVETGVVSLMTLASGSILETAMVGSGGVLPASVALGASTSMHRLVVFAPGNALRMRADDLLRTMQECPPFRERLLRYVQSLMLHVSQTALCAVRHHLEQRLACWLCLVCDALGDEVVLPVTHEHLANVLGFRRASVTEALAGFEEEGLVRKTRGALQICNRALVEHRACCCYKIVANAYKQPDWVGFAPPVPQRTTTEPQGVRGALLVRMPDSCA